MMTSSAPIDTAADNMADQLVIYDPNRLLDALIGKLCLKNDAALSHMMGVSPTEISNMRSCRRPVGPTMLIRMHEISELTIGELRGLMGDHRRRFRSNEKYFSSKSGNEIV